jgi:hypothetical protein
MRGKNTMADQYKGDCVVELMRTVGKSLARPRSDGEISVPASELKVPRGGVIVTFNGVKVCLGPEVLAEFRRIEAEKQAANASGEPFKRGAWQTNDEDVKAQTRRTNFGLHFGFT